MFTRTLIAASLAVTLPTSIAAQCGVEELAVHATGGTDFFGRGVVVRGDLAVIGAPEQPMTKLGPDGYADVYRRSLAAWYLDQRLTPTNFLFGRSVATDGKRIVVGSPGNTSSLPRVEVFSDNGSSWTRDQTIQFDATEFGRTVAIAGEWMAVGDPTSLNDPLMVRYRLQDGTWVQHDVIQAAPGSEYAYDLAMHRDLLVVGSPGDSTVEVHRQQGAGWVLEQTLTADDPDLCQFGRGVSVEDGRIAVGAGCDDAVLFYRRVGGTWTEVDRVALPTSSPDSRTVVDLGGDVAIAGVTTGIVGTVGRAFLLRRELGDWSLDRELFAADRGPVARSFGAAVSTDGDHALVGDPSFQNGSATNAGKALFYGTTRVTLSVDSTTPVAGDILELRTCGGAPGDPVTLVQTELDDAPVPSTTAAFGVIGADGSWTLKPKVPGSLIGSTATFEATVVTATGPVTSNPARIKVSGTSLPVCDPGSYSSGKATLPFTLVGTGSFATNGGQIVQWLWTFDDGSTASGAIVTHLFPTVGLHEVELTVTDSKRGTSSCATTVSMTAPPACQILGGFTQPFGTPVQFDGSFSGVSGLAVTGHAWDFGDGTTASGAAVQHVFVNPGTYLVTLTVSYSDGSSQSCSKSVTASAPADACLIAPLPTANIGVPTPFDGTGSGISGQTVVDHDWDFGDGATGSGATTTHAYAAPGMYPVTLTVTYAAGFSVQCQASQVVNTPPSCIVNVLFPTVSVGQAAAFISGPMDPDGTVVAFAWDFGDGTGAVGQNASHVYSAPGTYTVTLTVTDDDGATSSCTGRVTVVP